tara:strand:+ start:255 stop:1121 length:867 start_codon:yes stop_codon:yes gene_type:complete
MKKIRLIKLIKHNLKNISIGIVVGFADLFPGISGGTILFLTGKYNDVIYSINSIVKKITIRKEVSPKNIEYNLIITLLIGILLSVFIFTKLASFLFENYGDESIVFLIALMIFYSINLLIKLRKNRKFLVYIFLGLILGLTSIFIPNIGKSDPVFYIIILSGLLSFGFMILPGISGSSILLILGTYESTINAVNEMDLSYLLLFLSGGIAGFLTAIMLIKIILDQYRDEFRIIISGLIVGASIGLLYDLPKNSYLDLSLYIIFISGIILALILITLTNYFTRNESNQN